jgi:membrane protein
VWLTLGLDSFHCGVKEGGMRGKWTLSGMSWTAFLKRVWQQINEDDIWGRAAQLSYYFLLALFPLLLFLVTLFGYFAASSTELRTNLLTYLGTVVPSSAVALISATLDEISKGKGGGKLSFGILAALWAASNGMGAITQTLNVAYDVEETRPWWKVRLFSIGLTVFLAVLIISALVVVLYGGRIVDLIAMRAGLTDTFRIAWKVLQWPIALGFLLIGFGTIYYFAPNLPEQKWRWITPGSVVAVVLWLLVSFAFRIYLHFFNSYSATYGSLGALIILMLWFYLTGIAILVGGEINSELDSAAKRQGEFSLAK